MSDCCLFIMCGLPGAGKSTFVEGIQDFVNQVQFSEVPPVAVAKKKPRIWHICYDKLIPKEIEQQLIMKHDGQQWKLHRRHLQKCVDHTIAQLTGRSPSMCLPDVPSELWRRYQTYLSVDHDAAPTAARNIIIIDDNMFYRSMRYEYFQVARKYNIGYIQVYVQCTHEEATQRNIRRQESVSQETIVTMTSKLELPDLANAWERNSLTWTQDCAVKKNFLRVIDLCDQAMNNPVESLPEDDPEQTHQAQVVCSQNAIHQADQILRRIVSDAMKNKAGPQRTKEEQKERAVALNRLRTNILESMKLGVLVLPDSLEAHVTDAAKDPQNLFHQFLLAHFQAQDGTGS